MTSNSSRTRSWMNEVANFILPGVFILATMILQAASIHDELLGIDVPNPEFLPGTHNITVREGGDVQLPCSVRNLGTKRVAWRLVHTDRFLTIGKMTWSEDENISLDHSRSRVDKHITTWNLQIRNVKPKDAGLYECQITSRAGLARIIQLNVVGPPITKEEHDVHALRGTTLQRSGYQVPSVPVSVCGAADMRGCLISITGKKFVDLGEKIELTCNASGGKVIPDEIDWFKGGDKIDLEEEKYKHMLILKSQAIQYNSFTSILEIEHSKLTDSGNYICRSSRNDIANLPVTVLHAASANSRRETDREPLAHDKQQEPYYGNKSTSSTHVPLQTSLLTILTCVLLTFARFSAFVSSSLGTLNF